MLVMITLTAIGTGAGESITTDAAHVVVKALAFLVVILVLGKWVLPWVLPFVARSQELLLLFALALAVAGAAVGEALELSQEVGAFLAGVTLASTRYREAISARLTPLRDFLLLFFFIQLGAQLEFVDAMNQLGNAIVLSLFVLVGNPLIVMIIMGVMRYRGRTSFLAGLTVAQISEFSLILVALGLSLGHIGTDVLGLVTIVGLVTIGLSSYMILYSKPLANRLDRFLRLFERRITRPVPETAAEPVDVIVVGLGRFGGSLCHRLLEANYRVVGVDLDPSVPYAWRHRDLDIRFGDIESVDLIHSLPLAQSAWVVSTVPDRQANLALLHALDQEGYSGRVAVTANNAPDTEALDGLRTAAGHDVIVLRPFVDASSIAFTQVVDDLGTRSN